MKIRKKRKISPMMKILIITECIAVLFLLLLCGYKNHLPFISDIFKASDVDVVLDAGHGGYDTGAQGNGIEEKDITLAMVKEIGSNLEAAGYHVKYIRSDDQVDWADNESDDLKYRTQVSNESGAKLYVSIHVNSEENQRGSYGYEIWGKLKQKYVFDLAKNVLDHVSMLEYSQNRGMKDQDISPLYVLQHNEVPAILFEVGFINSDRDLQYMKEGSERKKFCQKTAEGIIETLKQIENDEKKDKS